MAAVSKQQVKPVTKDMLCDQANTIADELVATFMGMRDKGFLSQSTQLIAKLTVIMNKLNVL